MEEQMGRVLLAYGTLFMEVPSFKYLGGTISSSDQNWPAMEQNLGWEQVKWGVMVKIWGYGGGR